jgi:hypothetical protein
MTSFNEELQNPFPGLRPFESDDRPWFFGRESQIRELLKRLEHKRIVTVLGGSGCGKSSLIRAGLLPRLRTLGIPSAGRAWQPIVFTPGKSLNLEEGRSPLHSLASAFANTGLKKSSRSIESLIDTFNQIGGFGKLVDLCSDKTSETNYLFVIDQFEELFSENVRSSLEAKALVARIEDTWKKPHPHVFVVITMRSEHLNDCTLYPDFPEVINATSYLVRRLKDSELKEAILGPIGAFCEELALSLDLDRVNMPTVDMALIEQLLNEVKALAYDPDHLPLFQHCLYWLWRVSANATQDIHTLPAEISLVHFADAARLKITDLKDYRGKLLQRCLDIHAQEHFDALGKDRDKARALFSVLGVKDKLQTYKRKPLALSHLDEIKLTRPEYERIRDIMNSPHPYLRETEAGEIDIYHEALIRKWEKLREWVDEEYKQVDLYGKISSKLSAWQNNPSEVLDEKTALEAKENGLDDVSISEFKLERLYDWQSNPFAVNKPMELLPIQEHVRDFINSSSEYYAAQRKVAEEKAAAMKKAEEDKLTAEKQADTNRRRLRLGVLGAAFLLVGLWLYSNSIEFEAKAFRSHSITYGAALASSYSRGPTYIPEAQKAAPLWETMVAAKDFLTPEPLLLRPAVLFGERRQRLEIARKQTLGILYGTLIQILGDIVVEQEVESKTLLSESNRTDRTSPDNRKCQPNVLVTVPSFDRFPKNTDFTYDNTCEVLVAAVPQQESGTTSLQLYQILWRKLNGTWHPVRIAQKTVLQQFKIDKLKNARIKVTNLTREIVQVTMTQDDKVFFAATYFVGHQEPWSFGKSTENKISPAPATQDVQCESLSGVIPERPGDVAVSWRKLSLTKGDYNHACLALVSYKQLDISGFLKHSIRLFLFKSTTTSSDDAVKVPWVSFTGPKLEDVELLQSGDLGGWIRVRSGGEAYYAPVLLNALGNQACQLMGRLPSDIIKKLAEKNDSPSVWDVMYEKMASLELLRDYHQQVTTLKSSTKWAEAGAKRICK